MNFKNKNFTAITILNLLIKGLKRTEIARGLNIKVSTLNSYIRDIKIKEILKEPDNF